MPASGSVPEYSRSRISGLPVASEKLAHEIVDAAVRRYFIKARARVPAFVDATFGWKGALNLHRNAFGHDLWRAPLNAALVAPALGLKLAGKIARKTGREEAAYWLETRDLFLRTDVANAFAARIFVDLLKLPYSHNGTHSVSDALADEILADQRLAPVRALLETQWGEAMRARMDQRLEEALAVYMSSRFAIAELANMAAATGFGAAVLGQFTPGILTLGPAIAGALSSSPLAAITGVAATPTLPAAAASVAAAMAVLALLSSVSGVITDPAQAALGIHHRRLVKFLDALEQSFIADGRIVYEVRDAYAARLLEMIDVAAALYRHVPA